MERVEVLIVGSGFSGLGLAIRLHDAGLTDVAVLEKAETIGGTWRDNHYPGCACDVPSYLYSLSFAPAHDWTRKFAESAEIRAYLERTWTERGVRPYLRFGAEVVRAEHDGSRWHVQARDGRVWSARVLVLATGGLSRPQLAKVPGIETFAGPSFHSATWRHDVALDGKRVAVIGTGASAIQFVPHVAARALHLDVFQRSPPWIVSKEDRRFTPKERALLSRSHFAAGLYRAWIYGRFEARAVAFFGPSVLLKLYERVARAHLASQIADPELRLKLTPSYALGCKRILISNDYYPAIARPNVALVTDAIDRITEGGVITADGAHHPADVLIHGTGFQVQEHLGPMEIVGAGGRTLREAWREGAEAYKGTTVAGFPNLFLLGGPNTALGHNSVVFMAEAQMTYVLGALAHLRELGLGTVDVKPEVMQRYNAELTGRLDDTVWASGCKSWYRTEAGKNTALWPGFTFEFWSMLRRFDAESYVVTSS